MSEIHPQLKTDCIRLGRFPLSHLLLMNDCNYPWFILVPDRDDIREIYQLGNDDRDQLQQESCVLAEFLMEHFQGDKLNIAALGNMVPQLHLHHIVRFESDRSWPKPVWGNCPAVAYSVDELEKLLSIFTNSNLPQFPPRLQ